MWQIIYREYVVFRGSNISCSLAQLPQMQRLMSPLKRTQSREILSLLTLWFLWLCRLCCSPSLRLLFFSPAVQSAGCFIRLVIPLKVLYPPNFTCYSKNDCYLLLMNLILSVPFRCFYYQWKTSTNKNNKIACRTILLKVGFVQQVEAIKLKA